jgi:hypothetical protein
MRVVDNSAGKQVRLLPLNKDLSLIDTSICVKPAPIHHFRCYNQARRISRAFPTASTPRLESSQGHVESLETYYFLTFERPRTTSIASKPSTHLWRRSHRTVNGFLCIGSSFVKVDRQPESKSILGSKSHKTTRPRERHMTAFSAGRHSSKSS